MFETKYVIVNGCAIVFSAAIQHKEMVGHSEKCEGAGFVRFKASTDSYGEEIITAHCYGKSVSLGIESRREDSHIVTRQITNTQY
jgi:hypothetical protein